MAGEIFKQKREASRLDIKDISRILKINADYLYSIENDLFDKLPVEVYTTGYIRIYAKYLDIDPEPIIKDYSKHFSYPKASIIMPIASSKRNISKIFYLIPVTIIIMAAFFIYLQISQIDYHYDSQGNLGVIPKEEKVETNIIDNTVVEETELVVPEEKMHSLDIIAEENTWIYMKFADGKSKEISLPAGHSNKLEFSEKVFLRIGNAGGIKLKFDGKDMGALGEQAEVVDLTLPVE